MDNFTLHFKNALESQQLVRNGAEKNPLEGTLRTVCVGPI